MSDAPGQGGDVGAAYDGIAHIGACATCGGFAYVFLEDGSRPDPATARHFEGQGEDGTHHVEVVPAPDAVALDAFLNSNDPPRGGL